MLSALPEPGGCPHCGSLAVGYANNAGVRMCINCRAPRTTAEPGCPVRNVMCTEQFADPDVRKRRMAAFDAVGAGESMRDDAAREGARKTAEHIDAELLASIRGERTSTLFPGLVVPAQPIPNGVWRMLEHAESVVDGTARERRVHDGGPRILQHDPDTGETKGVR